MLCADTFFVGNLKGVGKVYLHAVVDAYGSYAFGFLHVSKQPEAVVAAPHDDLLSFYAQIGLVVDAVLTDNGREFCGTDAHPSGSMARLAYALRYYTASRRSEAFRLGRQRLDGGYIRVARENTGAVAEIWMHGDLRWEIGQFPLGRLTFLVTSHGKPFATAAAFGNWFLNRCDDAGLTHCGSHGLRKAFAAGAAERSDSDAQIASVTSHRDPAIFARYRAKANQRKMSKDSETKWEDGG